MGWHVCPSDASTGGFDFGAWLWPTFCCFFFYSIKRMNIYIYKLVKPLLEALILRPVYDPHLVGFFCSTCLKGCVYVWNFIFIYKISCINVYIILSWWILSLFSGVSCLVLSLSRCSSVTASKFAEELEECNDWWVKDIIFKQLGDTLIWRSSLCLFIYGYWRLLISMCPSSNVGYRCELTVINCCSW